IPAPDTPPLFGAVFDRFPTFGCPSAKSAAVGAVGVERQTRTRLLPVSATNSRIPSPHTAAGSAIVEPDTPFVFAVVVLRLLPPAGWPSAKSAGAGWVGTVRQTSTRLLA